MKTAKLFRHGGSQAVRLPKDFRFEGAEVLIERRGNTVILRPKARTGLKTIGDLARYLASQRDGRGDLSAPVRASKHERPAPTW